MTIDEIRRQNLAALRGQVGGVKRFADLVGMSESQLSQLINGSPDSRSKKPRGMRATTARRFEQSCGTPVGWLDTVKASEEPAQYFVEMKSPSISLNDALQRLAQEIAQTPADARKELSDNLRQWALYGAKPAHLVPVLDSLKAADSSKLLTGT
jgi:hypothetical protein